MHMQQYPVLKSITQISQLEPSMEFRYTLVFVTGLHIFAGRLCF